MRIIRQFRRTRSTSAATDARYRLHLHVVAVGVDHVMVIAFGDLTFDDILRFGLVVCGDERLADDGIDIAHAVEPLRRTTDWIGDR